MTQIKNKQMKNILNRISILIALPILLISCNQKTDKKLPSNVIEVLEMAGTNRSVLEEVINYYHDTGDTLKQQAAYFLIGNMADKEYITFAVADSSDKEIGFGVLDYPDYKTLSEAWDSITKVRGKLHQKRTGVFYDLEEITAEYLITNIDMAFDAWNKPWAKHLNFNQFCEYILPYRSTNEPLEDWRILLSEKYSWVIDSMADPNDPVEACRWINNDIKSWFRFDPRYYEHATDQGLKEMMDVKMGRCEDMTNLAIYSMRAIGVPVTSDFTPYWAKTGNNHAWNTILNNRGEVVIFMGGESNPGDYRLNQAKAKVYRKTFAKQYGNLADLSEDKEKAPKYINRSSITDVTSEYIPVADVEISLEKEIPDGEKFAYICVFNTGEWKAIHWSSIDDEGKVNFTGMGTDIAYLPAFYINGDIVPAGKPFILDNNGDPVYANPDIENPHTLELISTTKRITKNTTDNIEKVFLKEGETYELFFWDDGWVSFGKKETGGKPLEFKNVPSGALYWLINTKPAKDRPERIFVFTDKGEQVWY